MISLGHFHHKHPVFLNNLVWEDKKRTGHFRRMLDEKEWCEKNYLQSKSLWEVEKTIEEIKRSLDRFQIRPFYLPNNLDRQNFRPSDNNYFMLKVCVFGAFYPNYFMRSHGEMDVKQCSKLVNLRDAMRTIYFTGFSNDHCGKFGNLYVDQVKEMFK